MKVTATMNWELLFPVICCQVIKQKYFYFIFLFTNNIHHIQVPKQNNVFDCGVYMLKNLQHCVKEITEDPSGSIIMNVSYTLQIYCDIVCS